MTLVGLQPPPSRKPILHRDYGWGRKDCLTATERRARGAARGLLDTRPSSSARRVHRSAEDVRPIADEYLVSYRACVDMILAGPGGRDRTEAARLLQEAMRVAPPDYEAPGVEMLPRHKGIGRCRLCGEVRPLTKEHIPPKRSGNVATAPTHTLIQWLDRQDLETIPGGKVEQGGIWGYTLCGDCNSLTGREYGAEYQGWAIRAVLMLRQDENLHPSVLNENPEPMFVSGRFGGNGDGGVSPGAMVRQVLSCMCSLSGNWDLAGRSPAIRRIVLGGSLEPLPEGMSLWMEMFAGPMSRMVGPQVISDAPGHWAWVMEIAHPPFAFMLVLASNYAPTFGMDMGPFVLEAPNRRVSLEATWQIGFGWTPLPGDLRSKAAIEARGPTLG